MRMEPLLRRTRTGGREPMANIGVDFDELLRAYTDQSPPKVRAVEFRDMEAKAISKAVYVLMKWSGGTRVVGLDTMRVPLWGSTEGVGPEVGEPARGSSVCRTSAEACSRTQVVVHRHTWA
jgi:hypothetical protein